MSKKSILNLTSLKDQVYEYIRLQMKVGRLKPGDSIDMNAFSEKLGVSKTPLRDALIRLEMEGFVRILPRRGVFVNQLTIQDIRDSYQILGALESTAIIAAAPHLREADVQRMERLNEGMRQALERDDFNAYYEKNLQFHDIFLNLSGNKQHVKVTGYRVAVEVNSRSDIRDRHSPGIFLQNIEDFRYFVGKLHHK